MVVKNIVSGLVAGLVVAALIVGGVELARKPIDIPSAIKGEVGEAGADGAMGPRGAQGLQGLSGKDGAAGAVGATGPAGAVGPAGKDATAVNIVALAKAVQVELDRVILKVTLNGVAGDSTRSLVVTQGANYDFNVTHFGSGAFALGIKKSDGNLVNLVTNTGQLNIELVRYLAEGSYTLYISATSDWIVKVEEK